MKKSFPFQTPQGYFEDLTERTIRQVQDPRERPLVAWGRVAAVFLVVLSAVAAYLQWAPNPEPCVTFACLLEETETLDLESGTQEWLEDRDWMLWIEAEDLNGIDLGSQTQLDVEEEFEI